MLELLSEPLYILAAVQLRFRLRAVVDTAAIIAKSATTVALLQLTALPPALALSWAQMAFAATTLVWYGAAYVQDVSSWLVAKDSSAAAVCRQQDWADSSNQLEDSTQAQTAAVEAAVSVGTLQQRKLRQQQAPRAGTIDCRHLPAIAQRQLLHGPTLWLCGSFSLQVGEVLRAVQCYGCTLQISGVQSNLVQFGACFLRLQRNWCWQRAPKWSWWACRAHITRQAHL
jgi:Rft protein